MAQLGTSKRPAVVRVQDPMKAQEIMSNCSKNGWEVIVVIEPDEKEDISDVTKLLNPPRPITKTGIKIKRNDPCSCGSGKKYKKCCFVVSSAA